MNPREFFDLVDNWDFYTSKADELEDILISCNKDETERIAALEDDIVKMRLVANMCKKNIHEEVVRVRKILRDKENGK